MARHTDAAADESANEYVCKKCGEERTGAKASEFDHTGCEAEDDGPLNGLHKWIPTEFQTDGGSDEPTDDDWRTMSSDECKAEAGLVHVGGVVWEQTNDGGA